MPTVDAQGNQRFNKEWAYNNYTVGLVALVIQRIAGQPFWEFIRERILAPLGMHRTAVTRAEISSDENIAPPYLTTTTGEFRRVSDSFWPCASHAPLLGATGMRSTLNDMLTFSIAILDAERAETDPNYTRQVPNNPLRQVTRMRRGYWTRPADDPDVTKDAAYGMGWFVAQIPGSMISAFSGNGFTREKEHRTHLEYILGDSENDRSHPIPVIAHTGGMRGALFSVFTFPQTQSAIVTMTNGRDFGDASDWTAQVLIQALFDLKPEVDLLPWVKKERGLHEGSYQKYVQGRWEENRRASEVERERGVYLGEYVGFNGHFSLSIVAAADSDDATGTNLSVVFNNRKESKRRLTFYKRDVYSTHQGDEDAWKISQLIAKDYKQFLLDFAVDDNGTCTGLRWMWNKDTEPAWFKKVE
ncbi:beta-lactamase/transpeptidase-like protein [Aspergillus crustosus]